MGIRCHEQGPVLVVAGAHIKVVRLRPQVDHEAAGAEPVAVLRAQDRAAAGRQDDSRPLCELVEEGGFPGAKSRLALDLENHRHLDAAAALELVVGIDERAVQPRREHTGDRRLASAHHADEKNIAVDPVFHGDIVTAAPRGPRCPRHAHNKQRPGGPGLESEILTLLRQLSAADKGAEVPRPSSYRTVRRSLTTRGVMKIRSSVLRVERWLFLKKNPM